MTSRIEDLLAQRSDLSAFLVHLTRDTKFTAAENLGSILDDETLKARTALGMAQKYDKHLRGTAATQRVVSFSETPLQHVWMMCEDIKGRSQKFKSYGLVFERSLTRQRGCNPVWYLDITQGHDWLTQPINRMVAKAVRASTKNSKLDPALLEQRDIFKLTPFIEQMGNPAGIPKEFWWEREWRHAGDFVSTPRQVVAVIAPEVEHAEWVSKVGGLSRQWERRAVPLLDPAWPSDRILAALDSDHVPPEAG